MPEFVVTWSDLPDAVYWDLPPAIRRAIDACLAELAKDPLSNPAATYDPVTDHWTVDYGDGAGLLVYAAVPSRRRVIILRLIDFS